MNNATRISLLLCGLALFDCGRSDTLLPVAVSKAEPTPHFPETWEGVLTVGTGPSASPTQQTMPSELLPKRGKTARPNSIALVIGIEKYRGELPDAVGAATDAQLFSEFAEKTLGLPRRNIHLLVGSAATKSSIDAEISEWIPRNANPAGEVFLYFAGHGAPDPKTQSSYLVPWDADPKYITTQGIAIQQLVSKLNQAKGASVLIFIDACFSGAGGRSVVPEGSRPVVFQSSSPPPSPTSRIVMMTATGPDEITGMAPSGNGLFSYYLFLGLNGAADADTDSTITTDELANYVSSHVADESRRQGRDQVPRTAGLTAKSKKLPLTKLPGR